MCVCVCVCVCAFEIPPRRAYIITDSPSASFSLFNDGCRKAASNVSSLALCRGGREDVGGGGFTRAAEYFWTNNLAAWLFGVAPRLLGSNPAPWKDKMWKSYWIHYNLRLIELNTTHTHTHTHTLFHPFSQKKGKICCIGGRSVSAEGTRTMWMLELVPGLKEHCCPPPPTASSSLLGLHVCGRVVINASEADALPRCGRNRWRAASARLFGKWGLRKWPGHRWCLSPHHVPDFTF